MGPRVHDFLNIFYLVELTKPYKSVKTQKVVTLNHTYDVPLIKVLHN